MKGRWAASSQMEQVGAGLLISLHVQASLVKCCQRIISCWLHSCQATLFGLPCFGHSNLLSLPIMACPIFAAGRIYNPSADVMSERVITHRYMQHLFRKIRSLLFSFRDRKISIRTLSCARGAVGSQWEGYMSDNLAMWTNLHKDVSQPDSTHR